MIFPSFTFLYFFLPITIIGYFLCPHRFRNIWLLLTSLVFYSWGAPNFVGLLLLSSLFDYFISILLHRVPAHHRAKLLGCSIVVNIALLAYFKYFNFFIAQVQATGMLSGSWAHVVLPIGISFFTFHKISYVVDVYRGVSAASKNIIDYLLYITFFPQLIAGPIVRYHEIEAYLTKRKSDLEDWYAGATRFCRGLAKKVLLADPAGAIADNVFALNMNMLDTPYAWLGAVAYAVQLYFDFSGYSDMAIGLARIFGFHFPENFNQPYLARSFTEFWRRWHMSLSRWMRDYLYVPLGGNRHGTFKTYRNLWIVFLLSGLWHGANWTFIVWGAYHGVFLILDRLGLEKMLASLPRALSLLITFVLILIGWVLFRSPSISAAFSYLAVMFSPWSFWEARREMPYGAIISVHGTWMLALALIMIFARTPLLNLFSALPVRLRDGVAAYGACLLFILSVMALAAGRFSPFIYFQF